MPTHPRGTLRASPTLQVQALRHKDLSPSPGPRAGRRAGLGLSVPACRWQLCHLGQSLRSASGLLALKRVTAIFSSPRGGGGGPGRSGSQAPHCGLGLPCRDHRPAEKAGPLLSAPRRPVPTAPFLCSFTPERPFLPWVPGPGPGGAVTPLLFWKLLQVPDHQRPGSWATSVLSWVWFPGVAGSSLGLFWDHHKFHPPPVNGEFSSNSQRG